MRYNFVKFGITANLGFDKSRKDFFFLEQNKEKISQFFDFLAGPKSCLVLSGFQGTGKSKLLQEALSCLNPEVLLFKHHMYEATTLDDILMNLTIDFREYYKNTNTVMPKIDTKDFRERIQYYVKNINKPMLLVLESYENILKSPDTSPIINDFLFHLASVEKFKVVFVSRNFDNQIFKDKNIDFEKIIIGSLDEENVAKYLEANGIKTTENTLKSLIDHSHCYLKYLDMTIKILQTLNISLEDLIKEFEAKKINFSSFLIGKFINIIPEKAKDILNILTLIRQGVSEEFIKSIDQKSVNIDYLKNILILNYGESNLYIKDYFKNELAKDIDQFSKLKAHNYLADLYKNMLPKKPFEREITVSRSTMQRERDYHASFIENYNFGTKSEYNISPQTETQINYPQEHTENYYKETYEEELNATAENPFKKPEPEVNSSYKLKDYLELAEKYENNFDYPTAIFYYQKALEKNQDTSFEANRPNILVKIGHCYIKTHKHENAVQCFELAFDLYSAQKQFAPANETLFEIALEYKNNYKLLVAKNYIEKILNSPNEKTDLTLAKTYNLLADIEDISSNITTAKTLYKESLDYALKTNDTALICMAYFKYGLLLDDTNNQTQAIECYKKCIELCKSPEKNTYLSSAYSNLAGIFYERENTEKAVEYYQKALDCDTKTKNNEGVYFVYSKLANIYSQIDNNKSYKFLLNALQAAKRLKDNLYVASAYFNIGDYYYKKQDYPQAVKVYLSAKHLVEREKNEEQQAKINVRLNDLKIKLGEKSYNAIAKNFRYQDET